MTEPTMTVAGFDRILASMNGLCAAVATELETFAAECADDPALHARAQAAVARTKLRMVAALDTIRAEFSASRSEH